MQQDEDIPVRAGGPMPILGPRVKTHAEIPMLTRRMSVLGSLIAFTFRGPYRLSGRYSAALDARVPHQIQAELKARRASIVPARPEILGPSIKALAEVATKVGAPA